MSILHHDPADGDPVTDLPGFRHGFAAVNGTRLHYVQGGAGPAVLLLHGWPFTWEEWRPVMPLLAQAGRTVIAPDLRGMGLSAKPDKDYAKSDYLKRNVAKDVHELLVSLNHDTVDLMGVDIGMMVAFAYAARYPTHVGHAVLGEGLLPGFGLEEHMNPATGGYWHFGFHAQVEIATMLTEGKEAAYLGPMWKMMSASPAAQQSNEGRFLPHYSARGGMRGGFAHYATLIGDDGRENRDHFRQKLAMPVLVLNGEKGLPLKATVDSVRRVADRIEEDIVPGAAHTLAQDNPAWLAERLNRFFQS
ncbi:alpha/beta hydrolase [Sphingomonas oligophenolica]|uniref:Alpha/beta hydrolase n=1 Tax=Sphingomonas oligophenolica TaxID=301154 RepID=A0ABU9Y653_9SPHN